MSVKYIKFVALFFALFFFFNASASAQYNPDWQTISTYNAVFDIAFLNDKVWAATSGGLISYDPEGQTYETFSNLNGLQSIVLNSVTSDNHQKVIAGGDDGVLQIYSANIKSWEYEYSFKGSSIRDLLFSQDTLWMAVGKGLAVYVWKNDSYKFYDYFTNFKLFPGEVYCIELYADRIWLGTDVGLVSAPRDLSKYTINDPENWTSYTTETGLVNNAVYDLEVAWNKLYIGTPAGLSWIDENLQAHVAENWIKREDGSYYSATNIHFSEEGLSVSDRYYYHIYTPETGAKFQRSFGDLIEAFASDESGNLWIGLNGEGLFSKTLNAALKLDNPASNYARFLYKDKNGTMYVSSGRAKLTAGKGIYLYNGLNWKNYTFDGGGNWKTSNHTTSVYEDRFGNIWIPSWGGGLMVFKAGGELVFFNNNTEQGTLRVSERDSTSEFTLNADQIYRGYFDGIPENEKMVVIPQVKEGPYGRLWVANYKSANDNLITAIPYQNGFLHPDKEQWVSFGAKDGIKTHEGDIMCLEFDDSGRLWIGTFSSGVYVLDYNNTLTDKDDDKLEHYQIADNLYSNVIYSLAKDKDGLMWIGTVGGLNSFDGLNIYKHVGDPEGETGPLENQINQIYVDRYNNKWFATVGGVSILRAGKSAWDSQAWLGISTSNSKLVDENVQSIFVDPQTSEALIGTDNGISVYRGAFGQIKADFSQVSAGPNPFLIEGNGSRFMITKLRINSTVRIFTLNGALVRELSTAQILTDGSPAVDGGRAIWDGKDSLGNTVHSGVYLYMAYTEDGKSTAGKIAVVRK